MVYFYSTVGTCAAVTYNHNIHMHYLERKFVREYLETLSFVILHDMKEIHIQKSEWEQQIVQQQWQNKMQKGLFPSLLPSYFLFPLLSVRLLFLYTFPPFQKVEKGKKKAMMMLLRMMIMIIWKHFPYTKPQKQQHKHNRFHRRVIIISIRRSNRTVFLDFPSLIKCHTNIIYITETWNS